MKNKVKKSNNEFKWLWPIKMFFLAFSLSLFFSISSEFLLSASGIILSVIIILVFISISVLTDMIGVAVTACPKEPFRAMASRKVRGARESLMLLNNADKVASLCADVLGDVCGILSGAAGTSIVLKILSNSPSSALDVIVAALISSFIAGLTIFGKSLGKRVSINKSVSIVFAVGKVLSIFSRKTKSK